MKRIIDKLTEQGRSDEVDGLKKAAAPAMKKVKTSVLHRWHSYSILSSLWGVLSSL